MREKLLLAAVLDQLTLEQFCRLPGSEMFDIRGSTEPDVEWFRAAIGEADAIWTSLRLPLTADLLNHTSRLKVVVTNSTGTDHLALSALESRGVPLISLKNDMEFLRQITPTAELAFALILACARRLPECVEATRQGEWARHRLGGNQLSGKTLGIIGVGRLGSMVAEYAQAFRMRVLGCDPNVSSMPLGVEKADLQTLLKESDFISLHVHLNEETRNLIGPAEFAQIRRGAMIVNTSRGGLIDERALIEAMEAGVIQAAGLDVIDGEWLEDKTMHPLIAYSRRNPRLIITPHTGGACPEAGEMTSAHTMKKLAAFFGADF